MVTYVFAAAVAVVAAIAVVVFYVGWIQLRKCLRANRALMADQKTEMDRRSKYDCVMVGKLLEENTGLRWALRNKKKGK